MINYFRGEYGWLSNMTEVPIDYAGNLFRSVENAYIWAKSPNKYWLEFCLNNPPDICKKKSKEIDVRKDWEEVKLGIMYELLKLKFNQEPFKTKLLNTGNQNIIEGNYWNDKFWGMCLKSNPNEGENWLGRLIMNIRQKLKYKK